MKMQFNVSITTGSASMMGAAALALLCAAPGAMGGSRPVTSPATIAVVRVGNGGAALSSAATPTFIEEYMTDGTPIGSPIALPTAAAGSNRILTNSGTATSEGFLTQSANGLYLILGGYDAAVGTATVATSASATFNRVVGRVRISDGAIDTSTAVDMYSGGNIRGAVSDDGTRFWVSGTANPSSAGGVRFISSLGGTTSDQVSTSVTNTRVLRIFEDCPGLQLYVSSASGAFQGVSTVGSGLPSSGFSVAITLLSGFPTATGPSSYDFYFADPATVYVADDRTIANGGGIQKWTRSGSTWSLAYTLQTGLSTGCRGLTGRSDPFPAGAQPILATTTENSNNKIVMVTDTGPSSMITTVVSAGTNKAFRGITLLRGGDYPRPWCGAFSEQPASQSAAPGSSVSFHVNPGSPNPQTFQWRKGTTNLTDGGSISGALTDTLTINPIVAGDAGAYNVVVTNVCCVRTSDDANLTVTGSTCVADIEPPGGNGQVNIDDLFKVINSWGPCPMPCRPNCAADIEPPGGNCVVNIDDLFKVINSWGACQ